MSEQTQTTQIQETTQTQPQESKLEQFIDYVIPKKMFIYLIFVFWIVFGLSWVLYKSMQTPSN